MISLISLRNGLNQGLFQVGASSIARLRLQKTVRAERGALWKNQERRA